MYFSNRSLEHYLLVCWFESCSVRKYYIPVILSYVLLRLADFMCMGLSRYLKYLVSESNP